MEIALNLVQPMSSEPTVAIAGGNPAPAVPEGAFALFFAQMMGGTLAPSSTELQQSSPEGESAGVQKEDAAVQETAAVDTEKVAFADLAPALHVLGLVQQPATVTPQPVPADHEIAGDNQGAMPIHAVRETEGNARATSVVLPQAASASGKPAVIVTGPEPRADQAMAEPATEVAATTAKQNMPVAEPAAHQTKEARTAVSEAIPALSARAGEMPPAVATTSGAPADTTVQTGRTGVEPAAKVIPVDPMARQHVEAATLQPVETGARQPAPAAEMKHVDETSVVEEVGEPAPADDTPITAAIKKEAESGLAGEERQEQQAMPQVKEVSLSQQPAATTETVREVEGVKPATTATVTGKAPEPEHEHIMHQVKEKLAVHSFKAGNDQISFTLHPEELGELKIVMRMDDLRLKVDIITQNNTVREALMQNLEGLKESLTRQSITIDRFDVSTGGGAFNQAFHEGRHTGRDRSFQPYPQFMTGSKDPEQKAIVTGWLPREDSLVDVRF